MRRVISLSILCAAFSLNLAMAQESPVAQANGADVSTTAPATAGQESASPAVDADGNAVKTTVVAPEIVILQKIEEELKQKYKNEIFDPPAIQSLIYTPSQQSLLREARNGFNTRVPTPDEAANASASEDQTASLQDALQRPIGNAPRAITLSGIVFINPDDWTIWLNKRRITPASLPAEAVDLRVYREFIELRWYDANTNKVYPVRLRPNQTFNIDGQVFLPG